MYKKKFFFIVFEGVEGTGKSFQIKKLFNNLKKRKIQVLKTREPGGSKTAEKIRKLIFQKNSNKFDSLTDYYLMLAARNEHIIKTLLKAKKNKIIVISDRFTDSTYAYQVVGNKISQEINLINKKYILKNIKPNLTIVLKSNFDTIFSRLKKRANKNKFDKLNRAFYIKAQNAFLNIANKNKKSYLIFDSSLNDSSLEKKICTLVLKKIKY
jgi:dTMP kinase